MEACGAKRVLNSELLGNRGKSHVSTRLQGGKAKAGNGKSASVVFKICIK